MIVDLPVKTPVASAQPVILCDTREQAPLIFTNLASQQATLHTADYSILGAEELFGIERKSIPDLVACCMGNRARFERALHRLRGYRFKRLLVVGSEAEILAGQYHSKITPKAVLAALCAFEVRYCPVTFCPTPQAAARQIERWAFYFCREVVENANNLWRGTTPQPANDS
jgi:DNA excision repair protein ERCC-4